MKKLFKRIITLALCLGVVGSMYASAVTPSYAPYLGYEYNSFEESIAAPIGYLPSAIVDGSDFKFDVDIKSFTDIALDDHILDYASFYILDGANGVVYKTDTSLNIKCVFDDIKDKNGKKVNLKGATKIACDYSNAYFYIYKDNKVYVISSLSEVVKVISVNGLVSMTTVAIATEVDDVYDTYLCTVTSGSQDGLTVYTDRGKQLGFLKTGGKLTQVSFSKSLEAVLAIEESGNQILSLGISVIDGAPSVYEAAPAVEVKFNLANANAVISDSLGFTYFVPTSGGKIYSVDAMMGETNFVLDKSDLPEDAKVSSMNFGAMAFDPTDENLICLGGGAKPAISVFNTNEGYVDTYTSLAIVLSAPTDMHFVGNKYIYILDSGNSRILKVNKKLNKVLDIFANFYSEKHGYIDFYDANGFAVDEKENLFIADTKHERVLAIGNDGVVRFIITRPDEQLPDTDAPFSTTKVMLDRKGQIYIICDTINLGAFVYTPEGKFKSFYGSNTVTQAADVIFNYFRKQFLTAEQRKSIRKVTPIALTNFDIDDEGFVYTVTQTDQSKTSSTFTDMVRKLNYQSDNVFTLNGNSAGFGDFEWDRQEEIVNTSFGDVDVDDRGYINLIDVGRGKIFQYSNKGNLVTVFGGFSVTNSEQYGRFDEPAAIESVDDKILVLDKVQNTITVFEPTEYTLSLRHAYDLLDSSDADAALDAWSTVLKDNTNSQYPYYGMGRAYEMKGDYEKAMEYYKLAYAKPEYSKAFEEYRKDYISENIGWIGLIAIIAIVIIVLAVRFFKKRAVTKHGEAYSPLETRAGLPIYVLMHPVDGFEQFRTRNMQSVPIAFGLVIAYFLVKVFEFFAKGFAFNNNRPIDYDLFATVISTIGLYVLFVIANWAVCTLFNGKGRMKEILCVTGYALTPLMITTFISVAMSNFMTLEEGAFVSIIVVFGAIWAAIVLLMGLYTIHQYSFFGTVVSVLCTVLGMAVIALLVVLFFTLLNQFYSFLFSVYSEIRLR